MKVNKINVLIKTYNKVNKECAYLYEEAFSFAKKHNLQGCFGKDYFEINGLNEKMVKELKSTGIKFDQIT